VWWSEPDPGPLGAPFFVMGRVDGQVPPDVMPYNFGDSWLFGAGHADRRRLQDATVAVLAELHAIDRPEERFDFLTHDAPGDTPLRRRVGHTRAWYDFAAAGLGRRSPLIERCFAWLEAHWPTEEGTTVTCWGDSRIGNVMYRDFAPVAVLDWEMAALGPCELDVAWLIYGHRIFEDIAGSMGLPGMPDFLKPDDVAGTYETLTGHTPRELGFYGTYAALQYGIVFLRTGHRQVHFGEVEQPDDVDDLLMNREPLERMLTGSYWNW
jgi:aminoglycoside phosphotransferase (APT) family kinase protein